MTADRAARAHAVYDQVPPMADCKGHCWISCGPASMTRWERRRLALAGHQVTPDAVARRHITDFWCEALGPDGRCMAYDIRPLICRLWGAVKWLACPWGCQPEGGWLDDAAAFRLMLQITEISGEGPVNPEAYERLDDPAWTALVKNAITVGKDGDRIRFAHYGSVLPPEITGRKRE